MGTRLPILICVSEEVHGSHGTRKGATKGQKQALKKGGGGGDRTEDTRKEES